MQHSNEQSNHFFRNILTAATAVGALLVANVPFNSGATAEVEAVAPLPGDRECHSVLERQPDGSYSLIEHCEEVPVYTVPTLPDFPRPEKIKANTSRCFPIKAPGVGQYDVNINLAVVDPSRAGFATVYSPDSHVDPTSYSSINFDAGETTSNAARVPITAEMVDGEPTGAACVYSMSLTDVVVDVVSFEESQTTRAASEDGAAVRVFDSREKNLQTNGDPVNAGQTVCVEVGHPGELAIINAAVDNPLKPGYLTVHSSIANPTATANVNFDMGETVSNLTKTVVGEDGKICATPLVTTDVVLDVLGYKVPDSFEVLADDGSAVRLVDSRTLGQKIPAGQMLCIETGWPDAFVDINVAVTEPEAAGFFNAHLEDRLWGLASSGNFAAGETTSNRVIASTDSKGVTCVTSNQPTHIVVDAIVVYEEGVVIHPPIGSDGRPLDTRTDAVF